MAFAATVELPYDNSRGIVSAFCHIRVCSPRLSVHFLPSAQGYSSWLEYVLSCCATLLRVTGHSVRTQLGIPVAISGADGLSLQQTLK